MASRWLAFLVWGLVGFSAVGWLLRMTALPRSTPAHAIGVDGATAPRGDWNRLFGPPVVVEEVATATVRADSRFKLVGVVAARHESQAAQGLALIAVDGKPPRAYRVGAVVEGDTVLQVVRARGVELGPRGAAASVRLELAPLAPAATGTLPQAGANPSPAVSPIGLPPGGVAPGVAETAQPSVDPAQAPQPVMQQPMPPNMVPPALVPQTVPVPGQANPPAQGG